MITRTSVAALAVAAALAGACAKTNSDPFPACPRGADCRTNRGELRSAGYGPGPMHGRGPMGGGGGGGPMMGGPAAACPSDTAPLSDGARKSVERALVDERRSEATYMLSGPLKRGSVDRHAKTT